MFESLEDILFALAECLGYKLEPVQQAAKPATVRTEDEAQQQARAERHRRLEELASLSCLELQEMHERLGSQIEAVRARYEGLHRAVQRAQRRAHERLGIQQNAPRRVRVPGTLRADALDQERQRLEAEQGLVSDALDLLLEREFITELQRLGIIGMRIIAEPYQDWAEVDVPVGWQPPGEPDGGAGG